MLTDDQEIKLSPERQVRAIIELTDSIARNATLTDLRKPKHAEALARNIIAGLPVLGMEE